MNSVPKYSLVEIERRWLVDLAAVDKPGARTRKRRYSVSDGALDVYSKPHSGLAVFEVEFDDERSAQAYRPPRFVTREITGDLKFSGIALAQCLATVI